MTDRNEINGSTLTDETSSAEREAAQSVSAPEGNDCGGRKKGGKRGLPGALWKSLPGGAHLPRGVYPPQYPDQPAGDGGGELPAL